jgi:hypothetical protein
MVPVADILNHVTGKNNARLYYAKSSLQVGRGLGVVADRRHHIAVALRPCSRARFPAADAGASWHQRRRGGMTMGNSIAVTRHR